MPTEKTSVVNCNDSRFDVFIGRPSIWGNPFVVGIDGNRGECVALHRTWMQLTAQKHLRDRLHELKGKRLGCFCKKEGKSKQRACHGDTLAEMADALDLDVAEVRTPWGTF